MIKNINQFFKKNKINTIIIEEKFKPDIFKFKNTVECNTLAKNSLLLGGMVLKKIGIKNINLAFFDGFNNSNIKETDYIIMQETEDSIKKLLKYNFKINTLTNTYLKLPYRKIWEN